MLILLRGMIGRLARGRTAAGGLIALLLFSLSLTRAQAQSAAPTWQALVPPIAAVPADASARGEQAGEAEADRLTDLHSSPLSTWHRLDGMVETMHWTAAGRPRVAFQLRYDASLFPDTASARAAAGDGLATLWEFGTPVQLTGVSAPAFTVSHAGGQNDLVVVGAAGVAEIEVDVRWHGTAPASALAEARRRAAHVAQAALAEAAALPAPVKSPSPPPAPLFIAPPGTGPVQKSPSLLALGPADVSWGQPAPGGYRTAPWARISRGARRHLVLFAGSPAARFVRTVWGTDGTLYDGAALYPSAGAAAGAQTDAVRWNGRLLTAVAPPLTDSPYLAAADAVQAWTGAGESVLLARTGNVLIALAARGQTVADLADAANRVAARLPGPLHADGTQIVDVANNPVLLAGVNWYGAEQNDFVPGGLDYRTYGDILRTIQQMGFNTVRLPFSDQLVEQNPVVTAHLAANPDLAGLHALDILDRIVAAAGALGLNVILDNHRSEAGWSSQPNGLWYDDAYPDALFMRDWSVMAQRYNNSYTVIGADLRNEPHGAATWGDGNAATDWHLAAERAGDAVLAADPHVLVMVEGVQNYDGQSDWWGGNLMGVAAAPVELTFADGTSAHSRLVYSPHEYGRDNCGSGCPWLNSSATDASLDANWDHYWGYIARDPAQPYAAPIWVGEFGTCNTSATCVSDTTAGSQGQWFSAFLRYLAQHTIGWAYWAVNGTQSTAPPRVYGQLDWYGLLATNWTQPIGTISAVLQSLIHQEIQAGLTASGLG